MWHKMCFLLFSASTESDKEEDGEIQLEMVELTLGTLDLRESEICPSRQRRRRRKKKEEAKVQSEGRPKHTAHIGSFIMHKVYKKCFCVRQN